MTANQRWADDIVAGSPAVFFAEGFARVSYLLWTESSPNSLAISSSKDCERDADLAVDEESASRDTSNSLSKAASIGSAVDCGAADAGAAVLAGV